MIVGLTGSLGSGKSSVARLFAKLGARVISADVLVHRLLQRGSKVYAGVVRRFGRDIVTSRGDIDRRRLAQIVFKNPRQLKQLEALIHPVVLRQLREEIKKHRQSGSSRVLVLEVPLLVETGLHRAVDFVVVVKINLKNQLARIMKSRSLTKAEARRRIKAQYSTKEKLKYADIIIDNNGPLSQTARDAKRIWARWQHIR